MLFLLAPPGRSGELDPLVLTDANGVMTRSYSNLVLFGAAFSGGLACP